VPGRGGALLFGLAAMEMSRVDSSIATFFGVHNGLAMGSIYAAGSEEQKQKWLPPMARLREDRLAFGLTEPARGFGGRGGGLTDDSEARGGAPGSSTARRSGSAIAPWCDPVDHPGRATSPTTR